MTPRLPVLLAGCGIAAIAVAVIAHGLKIGPDETTPRSLLVPDHAARIVHVTATTDDIQR